MSETMTTTERLPVKLNADEIEINARALGLAHAKKREVEDELSQAKTLAKQKIEALDTEISSRSRVAVTGEEERSVPVQLRKNFQRSVVETIRLDTMELVGTRPMNPSERQQGLFEEREQEEDDARTYSKVVDEVMGTKKPSTEVEKLAKDIRDLEKKVPGFTANVVQPILDAKAKKKTQGSKKPASPSF